MNESENWSAGLGLGLQTLTLYPAVLGGRPWLHRSGFKGGEGVGGLCPLVAVLLGKLLISLLHQENFKGNVLCIGSTDND